VRSCTDSDLSDTDNLVPFENTTSINLISLLCVLLFCPFILINQSGIFKQYNVFSVRQISVSKRTHRYRSNEK